MEEDSGTAVVDKAPRLLEPSAAAGAPVPLAGSSLGMSDLDLTRARTAMDIRGHRETPRFLVDKPLEVWMYTLELISLYTCSTGVTSMMGKLAAELIKFDGDFLELSSPDFKKAGPTPLTKSMDTASGSQMFHNPGFADSLRSPRGRSM